MTSDYSLHWVKCEHFDGGIMPNRKEFLAVNLSTNTMTEGLPGNGCTLESSPVVIHSAETMAGMPSISVSMDTGTPFLLSSLSKRSLWIDPTNAPDLQVSVSLKSRCSAWRLPEREQTPLIAKVIIQRLAKILLIPCPVHVNILMKMFVGIPHSA